MRAYLPLILPFTTSYMTVQYENSLLFAILKEILKLIQRKIKAKTPN